MIATLLLLSPPTVLTMTPVGSRRVAPEYSAVCKTITSTGAQLDFTALFARKSGRRADLISENVDLLPSVSNETAIAAYINDDLLDSVSFERGIYRYSVTITTQGTGTDFQMHATVSKYPTHDVRLSRTVAVGWCVKTPIGAKR